MIEIIKRNGYYEAYIGGALYHYSSDLISLLYYLHIHSESIQEEVNEL